MLRTHTCGELRIADINKTVTLCGWVQTVRDKGGLTWVNMRDRYGVTQLVCQEGTSAEEVIEKMRRLGREFVIQATGKVIERYSKNPEMPTGDIEIQVESLEILNVAKTPPFKIEDNTDGGDDIRMQYRYLDLRRSIVRQNLELRHRMNAETRKYLDGLGFIDIETPVLIKSTPEGARDFVVPSRMNKGEFYALPQSPQTFKQILMVAGFDRYYQIVKCFRDEDLRADRQPEFTQIDCEMSFITQEDILNTFEGLVKYLFKEVKGIDIPDLPRMTYTDAMRLYGSDKPDTRFGMEFIELNSMINPIERKEFFNLLSKLNSILQDKSTIVKDVLSEIFNQLNIIVVKNGLKHLHLAIDEFNKIQEFLEFCNKYFLNKKIKNVRQTKKYKEKQPEITEWIKLVYNKRFSVFEEAEIVVGICAKGCAEYTRKQLDELTDFVKRPQIGAKGLVYVACKADGTFKSSVDKFYTQEDLALWAERFKAEKGDLLLILSGETHKTRKQLNELRLEMGTRLGLRDKNKFSCLWVVDFPLLEYGEEEQRWFAMHHPFTAPKPEDEHLLDTNLGAVRANAYDMVINGVEVGGGSIRIFQKELQEKMLGILGFSPEDAKAQFGFLMDAFEFGAPPHGGIAFGFDRLCSLFGGAESIRDFIAFPKNNSGRDVMINSPSEIAQSQLEELGIGVVENKQ